MLSSSSCSPCRSSPRKGKLLPTLLWEEDAFSLASNIQGRGYTSVAGHTDISRGQRLDSLQKNAGI